MDIRWNEADLAFRDEVRAFLNRRLTPEIRRAGALMTSVYADHDLSLQWQRILNERGWAAPSWPRRYGGCDWTVVQHYIFARECIAAGAPPVSPMGIKMAAPAIIQFGSEAQKAFFLPRMLSGEHVWCQGYSEPGAGSDLAALQMQAVRSGDHLICNGAKVWTTHANVANWMFCLVRTSNAGKKQAGITFLLIDMTSPGVEVRPLIMTSGEHIQNEVFFSNVRAPIANVLGAVDGGWTVAKYLLDFERGGSAYAPGLRVRLAALMQDLARQREDAEASALHSRDFLQRVAQAAIRLDALETYEFRVMSALSQGAGIGAAASTMKVLGTELSQHLTELALEAAGPYGALYQPQAGAAGGPVQAVGPLSDNGVAGAAWQAIAPLKYLNERASSIYAGSNEIQRNILAKAALGL